MRVETKVVTETYWVADDGTEFDNEYNCMHYELHPKLKRIFKIKLLSQDASDAADCLIQNWKDIKNLMES